MASKGKPIAVVALSTTATQESCDNLKKLADTYDLVIVRDEDVANVANILMDMRKRKEPT